MDDWDREVKKDWKVYSITCRICGHARTRRKSTGWNLCPACHEHRPAIEFEITVAPEGGAK